MAKYFLTGGLAGPWKKSKVSNVAPVYIPATATEDETTHEISIEIDATLADVAKIAKKNPSIFLALAMDETFTIYLPLKIKAEVESAVSLVFQGAFDYDYDEDTHTPQIITVSWDGDGIGYYVTDMAVPEG